MSYNVTVDDSDASLVYSGPWNIQGCEGCSAVPTDSQLPLIYGQTYHDGTVYAGEARSMVDFEFDGTAVYVYGWSVNTTTERPRVKNHDMTFMLDLDIAGEYKAVAGPNSAFKVLYFRRDNLEPGPHKLTMIVNPESIALLDYIVFTETRGDDGVQDPNAFNPIPTADPSDPDATRTFSPNSSPPVRPASNDADNPSMGEPSDSSSPSTSESHSSNIGAVVGIIVAVLLVIAGVFLFLWWRRRRQQSRAAAMVTSRTFLIDEEPGMMYIGAPGTPLSRYGTGGSSAPHTPTLQRQFLDPGTPAIYDAPEAHVHVPPPLVLSRRSVPPPQHSPLRIVTAAPAIPTARELPLPLGPPSEASYLTYPDTLDLPQRAPPLPPMPPIPPSPVAASPVAHGRQSVRRLVVYNAPSEVSATDENVADEPRRPSPPPPVPPRY